jgi:ribosomal protein S18 acetylase RimI-like enzyme
MAPPRTGPRSLGDADGPGRDGQAASRKLAAMSQIVTFTELGPAEFRQAISQFVAVYAAAMNPPDRMLAGRELILERHAANPGFRALAASAGDTLVGFTYGFHGVPGQWWHDMVAGALAVTYTPERAPAATAWLADSFEVAELHVMPEHQGEGTGRALLLQLTSGRPEYTAVLSTQDTDSRARHLYRDVGFTDLLTGFRFSGGEPPYAVMGARLPLRKERSGAGAPAAPVVPPRPSSW